MIFCIKNKTRRLRAYEAACSCAQPKKIIFLGVGNVDDGTAQPVNSVNDESKYWPNWREKFVNSRCCRLLFIYDTFGETSVELEVGQPYSTEGPSEPGEGGGCPPDFLEIISYSCFNQKVWGNLPPATLCHPFPLNFRPSYGPATDHDLHGLVIMSVDATEHSMYLTKQTDLLAF